jgi:hypothetical protein
VGWRRRTRKYVSRDQCRGNVTYRLMRRAVCATAKDSLPLCYGEEPHDKDSLSYPQAKLNLLLDKRRVYFGGGG